MTVRWRDLPPDAPLRDPNARMVTQVIKVDEIVPCDIPPGNRAFLGTSWVEIEGDTVREHGWVFSFGPGRFRAFDGLNGGSGPYTPNGNQVTFGWLERTLLAPPLPLPPRRDGSTTPNEHAWSLSQLRAWERDQNWVVPDVPYTFTIRGRVMQMASPTGAPRTFVAAEWE